MAGVVGGRLLAAAVVASLIPLAAANCKGGTVQTPGGPEVKVPKQEQPEMRRQCPVCSGRRKLGGVRCPRCRGFGRVRL